jgi:hypothetical protein
MGRRGRNHWLSRQPTADSGSKRTRSVQDGIPTRSVGTSTKVNARAWIVVALACLLPALGCQPKPVEGYERFIPEPVIARKTLAAMLDEWRDGVEPTKINVVDKHRVPGQRLVRHEILGEVATDGARGFAVRLTLENPDEEPVVRYFVIGVEPIWVFRQEDFELISHWMHPMEGPATKPAPEQ